MKNFNSNADYKIECFNIIKMDKRAHGKLYYSVESVIITCISSKICFTVNEPVNMEYLYENKLDYPTTRALVKEIWIKIPQENEHKKDDFDFYITNNPCFPLNKKLKVDILDPKIQKAYEQVKSAGVFDGHDHF